MSDTRPQPSLKDHTNGIRHLDAARAEQLVTLFARPAVVDDCVLAYDPQDPIADTAKGWLTLERAASDEVSDTATVGCYQTHLYLNGLTRLPLSVARKLAQHRGHLYLEKLREITDSVAAALGDHRGGGLSLCRVRSISVAAARSLGRHQGELSLDGVTGLSFEQALGLAQHTNELFAGGLKTVSSKVAAALAQHRGDLNLNGLVKLSGRAASHLARHQGKIHFHKIGGLSDAVAEAFGQRQGFLCLKRVEALSPLQAQLLSGHRGTLLLYHLEVDDVAAAYLGQHEGSLTVPIRNTIALPRLEALVQHVGPLTLYGLSYLEKRQARVLASQPVQRGVQGLSGLVLDELDSITPAIAAILATHRAGSLSLKGLTELTEDVARELVRHPLLGLDGVSSISDRVAGILATFSGTVLSLKGLRSLSGSALAKLRHNPAIELPPQLACGADRPASHAAARKYGVPSQQELIRAIQLIAHRGEEALRASMPNNLDGG